LVPKNKSPCDRHGRAVHGAADLAPPDFGSLATDHVDEAVARADAHAVLGEARLDEDFAAGLERPLHLAVVSIETVELAVVGADVEAVAFEGGRALRRASEKRAPHNSWLR